MLAPEDKDNDGDGNIDYYTNNSSFGIHNWLWHKWALIGSDTWIKTFKLIFNSDSVHD